jgi:hypothetical protein
MKKLKPIFFLMVFGFLSQPVFAFDCTNQNSITRELIEIELLGIRYQGEGSKCLDGKKFKHIIVRHRQLGDPSLLKPEFLVKKGTTFKVISQKRIPGDLVDVVFEYSTSDDRKIRDQMTYLLFFGKKVVKRGCAGVLNEPKHFAMREECF